MTQPPRQVPVFVETSTTSGTWMQRIDRHAARGQATREFLGIKRRRQFGLPIKRERIIEASTIEIVEQHSLGRCLLDARIAAHNHDPPGTTANRFGEAIDEREMRDVIDEKLQFDAVTYLQGRKICDPGIREKILRPAGWGLMYVFLSSYHNVSAFEQKGR